MSDPKRLLEENGDALENALLRSVQVDAMSGPSRKRILAELGVTGAILTASTAAASIAPAKAAKGVLALTVKWIAICSIAGGAPAAVWMVRAHRTAALTTNAAPVATLTAVAHDRPVTPPSPVVEPVAAATVTAPAAAPAPVREARPAPTAAGPTLSDEVAALQVARAALADHDSSAALAALDRYKNRFPSGRLAPEATVLRIEALVQRGDGAAASALADRFESAHPRSPYIARIHSILGGSKAPAKEPTAR